MGIKLKLSRCAEGDVEERSEGNQAPTLALFKCLFALALIEILKKKFC